MPAPLDLTGRRFGGLVALRRGRWSDGKTAWHCRCDCGEHTLVPLNRLNISDADPRAIRACEACRARRCAVCGRPYLKSGSAATCGDLECRVTYRRAKNADISASTELRNPGVRERRQRKYRSTLRAERPEIAAANREADAARARSGRQAMDETDRALRRAYEREYYHQNRDRIRTRYERWLDEMPPDQRADWDRRMRDAARAYRRRKALGEMMREARQLMDMEIPDDQ